MISESIFRENDIRGVYPEELNESVIKEIAKGIAKKCFQEDISSIVVARDGRLSGESLLTTFCNAIAQYGIDVNNIGLATSPMLYFAAKKENSKSGVMITGSHNPKNYNGIKMVINDNSVSGSEILSLIKNDETLNDSSVGNIIYSDIKEIYISEILKNIDTDISELKVVIDSGNGAAGFIAPELFKRLGCDVIELYSEVDGNFPNHHPDPGKLENLEDIISEVKNKNADIGFAFDGDGDRVGLITNLGDMIFPDKQMMLFSEDILKNKKGSIVFDVKCSNHLNNLIFKNGGTPIMAPTGHFHIKKAIKKNNALLGGEMSGHIFFNDKWYGFDDGPYAAVRAAEILAKSNRSIAEIFGDFPESFSTPELNITVTDENKFEIIDRFMANSNIDGDKILIDGLRVNFDDGWGLLRASNTTPKLVLRFEGDTEESMNRIQNEFIAELSRICPEIDINLD
ncbi:MAG: phosphomannomutase/phosphoglucomutase [Proteobacteria bacterium]|nr:phosphomannomutase/phosphoglucomutase [Pseudomonadota bacterium]